MKPIGVMAVVALLGGFVTFHVATAGPLDRGPMQQRYNPAAENMMRVPGVVGVYEEEALSLLQQAGLAVTIKRITRKDPKYRGKEGKVVKQVPSAGGVAMVGSTVVITVYGRGQGLQGGFGGGQWDNGNGGGWTPPPPEEGYGDGGYEDGGYGGGYEDGTPPQPGSGGDLGHDVPNVPPPAGGGMTGRPVAPGEGGLAPALPGSLPGKPSAKPERGGKQELLTPKQKRELQKAADRMRKGGVRPGDLKPGGRKGSSGKSGTIVGHRVGVAHTPAKAGGGKPALTPGKAHDIGKAVDRARHEDERKVDLTPKQKRELQKAADRMRKGGVRPGSPGTSGKQGAGASTPSPSGSGGISGGASRFVPPKATPRQGNPEADDGASSGGGVPAAMPSPVGRPAAPAAGALGRVQKETGQKAREETEKPKPKSWLDRLLGR